MEEQNKRNWCYFLHGMLLAKHGMPWPPRTVEVLESSDPKVEELLDSLRAIKLELDGRYGAGWTYREVLTAFPPAEEFLRRVF